ncbi:MAG: hypothetical protein PF447_12700, partial [Spirochaetaceae bacterium]|nr:hypothetical protein [Spirochaetaceae bacterium]
LLAEIIPAAEAFHVSNAENQAKGEELYRYDSVWPEYQVLVKIRQLLDAAGKGDLLKDYSTEMNETILLAAQAYYDNGKTFLTMGDRESGKNAYNLFARAKQLVGDGTDGMTDLNALFTQAKNLAFLNVYYAHGNSFELNGDNLGYSFVSNVVKRQCDADGFIDFQFGLLKEGDFINWLDDHSNYANPSVGTGSMNIDGVKAYGNTLDNADLFVYIDFKGYSKGDMNTDTYTVRGKAKTGTDQWAEATGTVTDYSFFPELDYDLYLYDLNSGEVTHFSNARNPLPIKYVYAHVTYTADTDEAITNETIGIEPQLNSSFTDGWNYSDYKNILADYYFRYGRYGQYELNGVPRCTSHYDGTINDGREGFTDAEQLDYNEWFTSSDREVATVVMNQLEWRVGDKFEDYMDQF